MTVERYGIMADPIAETPQPPRVPPKLRFHKAELAGVGIISLLPIAALLGAFGPTTETRQARIGPVAAEAEYPERLRTAMSDRISVTLANRSARPASQVAVRFDTEFMRAFSELGFTPEADGAYRIAVPDIAPGETRLVEIEVHAETYGLHHGAITVEADGTSGTIPVRTLIFP